MIYVKDEDEQLMCLMSHDGIETATSTFDDLEKRVGSLRGRRFYGLFREVDGGEEYICCTRIEPGDKPEELGLSMVSIRAGRYDRELLMDWSSKWDGRNIEGLPEMFETMMRRNGEDVDTGSYAVEYYRSQKELYLMLPLK